jgi:multicomponent Na+:H+ antiporter subunit B
MPSLILSTATRYLLPLMLLFSVFVLIRGHNEPGGGFIGGLVASTAYALYAISSGVEKARAALPIEPRYIIAVGLGIAVTSGMISMILGDPFMTSQWLDTVFPVIGKVGTPVMFDTGVYMVVIGVTLTIILNLAEEE